ncbi:exodeoxyribonuclease VII large subunit [Candidatus Nitronereus thalassa]|uniref:Exodeoxyribonuclease 7 large subunit n=1 Tax=Candidatus Nitronereus thalassa TaxID=3020898 RepID=A0ABU3KAL9_9BACT|nr:exodeoxyribonuclease VII large subunit [Candidatus Nitronereus thalassa]MDT7043329.1 exodeoxyribonuclease VII large subunit [Candidatus Nitronereus thalassa]
MTIPSTLTVTELTTNIRTSLERTFSDIWVQGEVSNLRVPSSGHMYFTLKDTKSQIRAVLFRRPAMLLRFALDNGLDVIVRGRVTVYEPRGDYQILVDAIEPFGVGALQLAYEQLKEKLGKEGLFDPSRKQPLPFLPERVGIITSQTGAALRDILTVLHRRCPIISVVLYPVAVQGEGAASQIAEAIRRCDRQGEVDVMIVGRGGGSLEDLWSFNEESVVRAIAEARVPVVSAVGHEIDITLSDFAADYRAPTPSAAAEAVAPVLEDLREGIQIHKERIWQNMQNQLRAIRHRIHATYRALPDPRYILQMRVQRVDDLDRRLTLAMNNLQLTRRPKVMALSSALMQSSPLQSIQRTSLIVQQFRAQINRAMPAMVASKRQQFRVVAASLQTLNPLAILSRGYSVLERQPGGEIVRSCTQVQPGNRVRARLADGALDCLIEQIDPPAHP